MNKKYPEYKQLNLPEIGNEIERFWENDHTFQKSVIAREGHESFVFYEGPPSANGMPGIHHVISRTLKDLVCRYKTMQGYQVKRKGGWDTHGLPVELGVEKLLGITKEDIGKKISVEEYNATCRREVLKFKDKWDELTRKMGYWVDLDHPYITFENNYIETLWWCLKELYNKGYLYESVSIQPYSPAAGTGLSSHELNQPGTYKDVKDTSVVAMFKAVKNHSSKWLFEDSEVDELYFLAWTTTPWTLPSNLGLTVGPRIKYALVQTFNPYTHLPINVVLAEGLIQKYFKNDNQNGDFENYNSEVKELPWRILSVFNGEKLSGINYEQLLPSEANTLEKINEITPAAKPFKIITGDFVTTEDGTGIVHTAPAFGADDYKAGQKNNLGILTLVDKEGKFVEGVGEFGNRYVKNYKDEKNYTDVNVDISVKLKKENRAFKVEKYEHNYPHCWRTDKPIIYYPLDAWFIKTTAVKDRMIELNKTINWKPASTGTGRFGNWLENMVDWNLSRSRFWGTPLPIWKCGQSDPSIETEVEGLDRSFFNDKRFKEKYDELIIGSKKDLIQVKTAGNRNCEGYKVDFNKIRNDLKNNNSDLRTKIEDYKKKTIPSFNFEGFKQECKERGGFDKKALIDLRFTLRPFIDYIKKVDVEISEGIDLHKPEIDNIIYARNGSLDDENLYARVDDLIDVWFDSGAMPYAQLHYPFENKKDFKDNFPADFIAEGVDQTRGWFYTLHALAVLLFDSVAYKTVVSNGFVLDKNGNKMSKRVGNVVDPFETLDIFGPDATRWYLITNASPWDSLKFDMEGIKEVQRKFFGTLYNTYQFFALYANLDQFYFKEKSIEIDQRSELDQWIISELNTLVKKVVENFDQYEPTHAGRDIEYFVNEQLSNWYVRLCRRRFWKPVPLNESGDIHQAELQDKIAAYQTLYECLDTISTLMAPISPFFAEWLYRNLNEVTGKLKENSIHLRKFPDYDESKVNEELESRMEIAQDISSLILSLRKKSGVKVRQPLQKVLIPSHGIYFELQISEVAKIIKAETNIKEIDFLPADNDFIKKKVRANFKTLGKKLGVKMKWAAEKINTLADFEIEQLLADSFLLNPDFKEKDEDAIYLKPEDVEVTTNEIPGYEIAVKGSLTVALDLTLTPELEKEGFAREFINRVQNIRKERNFELTDKIELIIEDKQPAKDIIIKYNEYICAEILAQKIDFQEQVPEASVIEVNNDQITLQVNKKT